MQKYQTFRSLTAENFESKSAHKDTSEFPTDSKKQKPFRANNGDGKDLGLFEKVLKKEKRWRIKKKGTTNEYEKG